MKIILTREEILRWASKLKSEKGKNVEQMTYSQINPTKVGGFSRRTPNLNHSAKPKTIRGVPLNENAPNENTLSTKSVIIW